jgi:hypothetical protein
LSKIDWAYDCAAVTHTKIRSSIELISGCKQYPAVRGLLL